MTNQTDDKDKTRYKILGELESIKSLLEEDGKPLEPPLLTDPIEDDEAPLLTEAWHEEDEEPAEPDSEALAEADIPVLQETIDEHESTELLDDVNEGEDIVSRALRQHRHHSLFDAPATDVPAERSDFRQQIDENGMEDVDHEMQAEIAEAKVEEQPGLFDAPSADIKGEAQKDPTSSAAQADRSAPAEDEADSQAQKKSENPFLPKHIRDRLNANRALQQEMIKGFTSPPFTPLPPTTRKNVPSDTIDEKLIDQLVQRYLPKIEAELRDILRELVKEERKQLEDPDQN